MAAFEVALRTWPVAALVSVIFALGTTAPLGSFTTPRSDVVAIWAKLVPARTSENRNAVTAEQRLVTFPPGKGLLVPRGSAQFFSLFVTNCGKGLMSHPFCGMAVTSSSRIDKRALENSALISDLSSPHQRRAHRALGRRARSLGPPTAIAG